MTANSTKLKRLARRRQQQTGERYTDALAAVRLPMEVQVDTKYVKMDTKYVSIPFLADNAIIYAPDHEIGGGRYSLIVEGISAIGQDEISQWLDETAALDASARG